MGASHIPSCCLFLLLCSFCPPVAARVQSDDGGFISALVTEKGLDFARDLLVDQAIHSLVPLRLHDMEKSFRIPFIGEIHAEVSNITLLHIEVSSSTIQPGDSGVVIVASGAVANLSMDWYLSYSTWLGPFVISDRGRASVRVEGMEVGLTLSMENQEGSLKLTVLDCGCYMEAILIRLEGGASWFYQGFVNAFEDQIRAAVETAIKKKTTEGISKLDSFLRSLPKEIRVDDIVSLNVTFVDEPLLGNSSIEFYIDGIFIETNKAVVSNSMHKNSQPSILCEGPLPMLGISLDEAVFNSASVTYFKAGQMTWIVDKVPDQTLLNTAGWRFIIPQLYRKYPNDEMKLNISLTSPPTIKISKQKIDATIFSDMTVDVLDADETVPVACISMIVMASGVPEISGNNLAGRIALQDFTLNLKWSKIGNFHMSLIQGVMRAFLNNVFIPYVNTRLRKGFPLPIIHGFTVQNANILSSDSRIVVCTDLMFTKY
uniref:Putative BPI/LBP family protein At1g04970 n=1 Tax=Anthurium amnicola TaxID=1678845 RepID=A0A1D1YRG3_9ARAE